MTEGLPDQPACLAAGSEYLLQTGKFLEVCLFFVELVELDEVPINTGMGFLSRLFKIGDVTWFSYVFLSKTTNIMETWAFSMAMAFPKRLYRSVIDPSGDYTPRSPGPPREFLFMALMPRRVVGGRRWRLPFSTFPRYVSSSN